MNYCLGTGAKWWSCKWWSCFCCTVERSVFGFLSYLVLHKMHCDIATSVRRLPRFVIVPCTFLVGILVQIIAVAPSESL